MKTDKTRCGGLWTEAKFNSFVKGLIRQGLLKWGPKHEAIKRAYIDDGINPKTGKKCMLHRCEVCNDCFAKGDMRADHLIPLVPLTGFDSWSAVIERAFVEKEGFSVCCLDCHKIKTLEENRLRREHKKKLSS